MFRRFFGGADSAAPSPRHSIDLDKEIENTVCTVFLPRSHSDRIRDSILRNVKKVPYPLPMEDLVPSFRLLDDSLYAVLMKQRLDLSSLPSPSASISSQTYFLFGYIRAELDRFPLSAKLLERFYQFFCGYAQAMISLDPPGVITDMTNPNILAFFTNGIRYELHPLVVRAHAFDELLASTPRIEMEVIDPFSGDYSLQSFEQDHVVAYLRDSISDKKNAWVLDKLESVLLFLDDLSVKKLTYRHILTSSLRFAKMNLSGSLLERFMKLNLFEFVEGEEESDVLLDDLTPQSIDTLEFFTMLRSNFLLTEGIISSPLYKKMKKLVFFVLSHSILDKFGVNFDTFGYTDFEKMALEKKYNSRAGFIHTILDFTTFICERGIYVYRTGNFDGFLHNKMTYQKWFDSSELLQRQSQLMHNPEAHGFTEFEFRANLARTVEEGEAILRHSKDFDAAESRFIRKSLSNLYLIDSELTTRQAARESRDAPFSVLVCGASGIGKSSIKDMLCKHFAKTEGLPLEDHFVYTRNPAAKFWDGFSTSMHTVVLDDVAFMNPNKAANGDPSVLEFLQVVNSVPFVPDQASLDEKGRTPLKARFCLATTNTEHLNAHVYFSCPAAARRRFPYIIVPTVKTEYQRDDGSGMLDSTKVPTVPGYQDSWNWVVKRVSPLEADQHGVQGASTDVIFSTGDVNLFLQWFSQTIKAFDKDNDTIRRNLQSMNNITICGHCFLDSKLCKCIVCAGCSEFMDKCECEIQSVHIFEFGFLSAWFTQFCLFLMWQDFFEILYNYTGLRPFLWMHAHLQTYINLRAVKEWSTYKVHQIRRMGSRIHDQYTPEFVVGTLVVLSTLYAAFRMYNVVTPQSEPISTKDIGSAPKSDGSDEANVWYNEDVRLTSFQLTPQITSSKSLSIHQFLKGIAKNLVYAVVPTQPFKCMVMRLTCLKGNKYVVNNHCIPQQTGVSTMRIRQCNSSGGISSDINVSFTESDVVRYPKTDLCIITLNQMPPKKGIMQYIPESDINVAFDGIQAKRDLTGEITHMSLKRIRTIRRPVKLPGFDDIVINSVPEFMSENGDCGSLIIGDTPKGYIILGIHALCHNKVHEIIGVPLTKDRLNVGDEIGVSAPLLSSQSKERNLLPLHPKSVFRYIDKGSCNIFGSFDGFRPTPKSMVTITPMLPFLSPHGYKVKYFKPIMRGWKPWRIAAMDMVEPVTHFRTDVLESVKFEFWEDIRSRITPEQLDSIHVLDDFTALNGACGVKFIDKMNTKASAGNPWKKSKEYFLEPLEEQRGYQNPLAVNEEIQSRMDDMLRRYLEGDRVYPNFCAHLKDEPVSLKKATMGKTRVFAGAPLDWSLLVRKYFLSHVKLIQENRFIFEAGCGTVVQSYQWTDMHDYLVKHGSDRIVAGDYKSFDKKMSPLFIRAAFDILIDLAQESECISPSDLLVMRGIAIDTAYPLIDFNGDLVEFFGSNPSGHPLTVIINSLVNSLYMRYVYRMLNPQGWDLPLLHSSTRFKESVSLMTYGDDNIMSVSEECSWFNHVAISGAFNDMGIVYTMPDKESDSVPYVSIYSSSFLKRSWVWNDEVGAYLAPLDHDSIERQLTVWVASTSISESEQALEVITGAGREYFFYGREVFEEKQILLKEVATQLGLEAYFRPTSFLPFDVLKALFWDSSDDCEAKTAFEETSQLNQNSSLNDSYCSHQGVDDEGEWVVEDSHQGVPQSSYLGMDRLDPQDTSDGVNSESDHSCRDLLT
jgi:hypothetical protein